MSDLKPGHVVRVQDQSGKLKALVVKKSEYPRSYIVQTESGQFRRNRQHLLKVEESFQKEVDLENVNDSTESVIAAIQDQSLSQSRETLCNGKVIRSGRTVKVVIHLSRMIFLKRYKMFFCDARHFSYCAFI